ncbi:hypothetical protein RFM41_12070 [Mesorhizobium sp. VK25A]|uniref:Uncharacterized protein n=1 Tax=Mesorhizobium vachelliae TaxID=3072309 RepID=A0ABU5A0L8_9HYPH|nr:MULTISPECIES: hypothetical protein [unclassified Mesorhizobium]MDX8530079.1 hypothetical protein [Mesorhizobium sp. VK25D]MDX8544477.1 hypothetical protein [Mesorhizobium sp. VK25A]
MTTIFWSWQSDRDPKLHHYFVRDALKDACKLIAVDPDYEEAVRPEVDHDTKNVAGTPDITKTILDKIAKANVFVADMTPVGVTDPAALQPNTAVEKRSEPKHLQNPNVMSELGYAEHALSQGRIILVANGAHYPGPVALPFDWRHRSGAKVYTLKDGATKEEIKAEQKRFAEVLKSCIAPILAEQAPARTPPPPIAWQAPSSSDRAIWPAAREKLEFRNNAMEEPRRSVELRNGTRIFARIAPREWSVPAKVELEQRIADVALNIRGRDGDWGLNGDGALSVSGLITGARNDMIVINATQWFQSNGELWAVNTNCFAENSGGQVFASALPFAPLDMFLGKGVAAIRAMGGKGPIGIRLGAGDLTETVLPGEYQSQRYPAVSAWVDVGEELDTWTPDERRALLFRFWNALMDAYGRPPARSMTEFEQAAAVAPLSK